MEDFFRKLNLLKQEDFIWLIYFFIVTFAIISNKLERNYVITNNQNALNKSKKINTTILIVAFFIYLYFVIVTIENFDILKRNSTKKEVKVAFERLIANILFLVAGAVAIYADFDSNTTGTDIAIF